MAMVTKQHAYDIGGWNIHRTTDREYSVNIFHKFLSLLSRNHMFCFLCVEDVIFAQKKKTNEIKIYSIELTKYTEEKIFDPITKSV